MVDRFERRRRAIPVPIRVFDVDALLTSSAGTMQDFLAGQAMVFMSPCPSQGTAVWCIRARGRSEVPLVYLDERRLIGGLDHLAGGFGAPVNRFGNRARVWLKSTPIPRRSRLSLRLSLRGRTSEERFRANPPYSEVIWSLRNNMNCEET